MVATNWQNRLICIPIKLLVLCTKLLDVVAAMTAKDLPFFFFFFFQPSASGQKRSGEVVTRIPGQSTHTGSTASHLLEL